MAPPQGRSSRAPWPLRAWRWALCAGVAACGSSSPSTSTPPPPPDVQQPPPRPDLKRLDRVAGQPGGQGSVDGSLVAAHFQSPWEVVGDGASHLYVADQNVIRAVDRAAGAVTTLAGTFGPPGSADGVGAAASFNLPSGLAYAGGQLYVADTENHLIRKIDVASGQVTTLAGAAGVRGSSDGAAADARFGEPEGIALAGDVLYVCDTDNDTVRAFSLSAGTVTTPFGTAGASGLVDGVGAAARFYRPKALRLDASGNLYVADAFNDAVRKIVVATGAVSTLATFPSVPQGLAFDGNDLLVSLQGVPAESRIVRIVGAVSPGCTGCNVSLVAGSDTAQGFADGAGGDARFDDPAGLWSDGAGTFYVADAGNYVLRSMVLPGAGVTTYAGALSIGSADGTGAAARFSGPLGLAADDATAYVADTGNHTIRRVDLATGAVTTLAGTAGQSGYADGPGAGALFYRPEGLALDAASNALYVADTQNRTIRRVDVVTGVVSTPAFQMAPTFRGLDAPSGLALYQGRLFVTDFQDEDVVVVDLKAATMSTFAGTWGTPGSLDGVGTAAGFNGPQGIASDGLGHLFVTDNEGSDVRRIDVDTARVTTVAGHAPQVGSTDGAGADARFDQPVGLAADTYGDLYVADTLNNLVRHVDVAQGAVTTVIGSRTADGVLLGPLPAQLTQPTALALTPSNELLLVSENALLLAH